MSDAQVAVVGAGAAFEPLLASVETLPEPLSTVLVNDYGLLSVGPLLFVWAGPTMLAFAILLGVYKNSGLLTRLTVALHPTMRTVGLSYASSWGSAVTSRWSSTVARVRIAPDVRRFRRSPSARRVPISSPRRSRCSPPSA